MVPILVYSYHCGNSGLGDRKAIIKIITMVTNSKEIHLYDSRTKEYKRSFVSQSEAEHELGLYRGEVRDILNNRNNRKNLLLSNKKADIFPGASDSNSKKELTSKPGNMLSEDELRKKHDMFFMILTFVKDMPGGMYIDEPSMLRQLSLYGKPRYREALSRPELKDHKGKVDGVIYYGSVNSIKKLKSEGVLQ